jgi:RNA polymerase-binding transcription factor DksA
MILSTRPPTPTPRSSSSASNKERDEIQMIDDAIVRTTRSLALRICGDDVERKRLEAVPWAKHC